jgi:hypothetical protein
MDEQELGVPGGNASSETQDCALATFAVNNNIVTINARMQPPSDCIGRNFYTVVDDTQDAGMPVLDGSCLAASIWSRVQCTTALVCLRSVQQLS